MWFQSINESKSTICIVLPAIGRYEFWRWKIDGVTICICIQIIHKRLWMQCHTRTHTNTFSIVSNGYQQNYDLNRMNGIEFGLDCAIDSIVFYRFGMAANKLSITQYLHSTLHFKCMFIVYIYVMTNVRACAIIHHLIGSAFDVQEFPHLMRLAIWIYATTNNWPE